MKQIVYGDVLFAVNFSMDMLSLYVTGKIASARTRPVRALTAAALGATYATAAIFVVPGGVFGAAINLAVAAVMCLIAFTPDGVAALARRTILFYAVGFLLGGAMSVLYSLLGRITGVGIASPGANPAYIGSSTPVSVFAAAAAVTGIISVLGSGFFARRRARRSARIKLRFGENEVEINGVFDTGNLVREPISGAPVIFVSRTVTRRLLPPALAAAAEGGADLLADLPRRYAGYARIVPVSGVNGSSLSVAVRPDATVIDGEEKKAFIVCTTAAMPRGHEAVVPAALA